MMIKGEKILDAPPPLWTSDEFCCMARSHLCEDKTFPSPFLSWTENPKRALDLIVESDGSETSLSLAVVDYNVLERDLIRRFGEGAGPWLVKTICDTFGLSDLNRIHDNKSKTHESRKGYTGTGEFLTWCSVQCDLLVGTLDTAAAMKLYKTMEDMKRISYKAGLVLGECLQDTDMNDIYREVVSYKLTRAFKKLDCLKGSPRYKSFIQGVSWKIHHATSPTVFLADGLISLEINCALALIIGPLWAKQKSSVLWMHSYSRPVRYSVLLGKEVILWAKLKLEVLSALQRQQLNQSRRLTTEPRTL
ncbi:hypothetical protein EDD37DRAFT_128036 [Exophiala viscosa]|uniref:uncharacterized protein n=1 Tax=Exophiala viscosa TaxID=2486360 RepID=UPI0021A0E79D|nr:hypothetical protein EDD37DRAFT_128036 [Exophiala viscosa]